MEIQVAEKKIREIFRMYKNGEYENNVQNHRFAAWGLTTAEFGGSYYIVGNKRFCELWSCEGFDSRPACGKILCRVSNSAEGYAELCHVFEQHM